MYKYCYLSITTITTLNSIRPTNLNLVMMEITQVKIRCYSLISYVIYLISYVIYLIYLISYVIYLISYVIYLIYLISYVIYLILLILYYYLSVGLTTGEMREMMKGDN